MARTQTGPAAGWCALRFKSSQEARAPVYTLGVYDPVLRTGTVSTCSSVGLPTYLATQPPKRHRTEECRGRTVIPPFACGVRRPSPGTTAARLSKKVQGEERSGKRIILGNLRGASRLPLNLNHEP